MRKYLILNLMFFLLFCCFSLGYSQEFYLNNLILDNINGKIQIRFSLDITKTNKLISYLKNGVSLRLKCKVELRREKKLWWDSTVYSRQKMFTLSYNPLTKDFIISSGLSFSERDRDLKSLFDRVWKKLVINLGTWKRLKKGKKYIFQIALTMERSDIPAWIKKVLFFINWDVIAKKTYRVKFYL